LIAALLGAVNGTVGIFEDLMDARTLFLTANTESVYAVTWLDLKDGPVVVESAPNTLGILDDFFFNHVADLGNAGPDRGQGGTVQGNPDGSTTIWFGPEPLEGRESNWVPTVPGKGWFTVLRLYGPLEPWFDGSWRLGELMPVE
jgi:hypothetical protein